MKLSEVFTQLTYGELSQISLGGAENGGINVTNYGAVVAHVNLGLTALYKRFPLKEGRILLQLVSGRATYPLTSAYALSNDLSLEQVKYILDTQASPFTNDIHKVERIYAANGGEFGLNDHADSLAISTPSAAVLRVPAMVVANSPELPEVLKGTTLEVIYRADHPKIQMTEDFDPELVEIELPYSHLEALLYFIASRAHNPMGMVNEFNMGNNWNNKYEMECQKLEVVNLRVDQVGTNTRLERNGWV